MNELLKNLGVIILLIGVVILAVPALTTGAMSNTVLLTGLVVIIIGYLSHIVINKRIE